MWIDFEILRLKIQYEFLNIGVSATIRMWIIAGSQTYFFTVRSNLPDFASSIETISKLTFIQEI